MVTKRSPRLTRAWRKRGLWAAWARHCHAPTPAKRTRMTAAVTVVLRGARINQFVASTLGQADRVVPAACRMQKTPSAIHWQLILRCDGRPCYSRGLALSANVPAPSRPVRRDSPSGLQTKRPRDRVEESRRPAPKPRRRRSNSSIRAPTRNWAPAAAEAPPPAAPLAGAGLSPRLCPGKAPG